MNAGAIPDPIPDPFDALAFLNAVLSPEGLRCVAWRKTSWNGTGLRHEFFETNAEAAARIRELAAEAATTIYYGCATFGTLPAPKRGGYSREAINVVSVMDFWLDLDVADPTDPPEKAEKKYPTVAEAEAALRAFIAAVGLPQPVIAHSGGGLHVHWPTDAPLDRAAWLEIAGRLKLVCSLLNLRQDLSRTADAASVLRPPGTPNHKPGRNGAVVRILQWGDGPISVARFRAKLEAVTGALQAACDACGNAGDASGLGGQAACQGGPDWSHMGTMPSHVSRCELRPLATLDMDRVRNAARALPVTSLIGRKFWREMLLWPLTGAALDHPNRAAELTALFIEVSAQLGAFKHEEEHADGFNVGAASAQWKQALGETQKRRAKGEPTTELGTLFWAAEQAGWRRDSGGEEAAEEKAEPHAADPDGAPLLDPWQAYAVPAFPDGILPPHLANYAAYLSETTGADYAGCAMAALTACSGALDQQITLQMKRTGGFHVRPLVWNLMVGDPGTVKSPVINAVIRALQRLENAEVRQWQAACVAWGAADKSTRGTEPAPPTRYLARDVTSEKLADLLSQQDRGILYVNDEMSGWLGQIEKAGKGSSADRALWAKAYQGGSHTVDRIGRGSIYINNLAVSVLGGIQPNRLGEIATLTSDGLMQRFLPVMLRAPELDREADSDAPAEAFEALVGNLTTMTSVSSFKLDPAAQAAAGQFREYLHDLVSAGAHGDHFLTWVNKLRGVQGALSLLLHIVGGVTVLGQQAPLDREVREHTVRAAERLVRAFLMPHALAFFESAGVGGSNGRDLQTIGSFVLTSDRVRFRPSDFTSGPKILGGLGMWDLAKRLSPLVAGGWLIEEIGPGGVVRAWRPAPGLRERFATRRTTEMARKEAALKAFHEDIKSGGAR